MRDGANIVFLDRGGETVFVEYIGKTEQYLDALYGTGMWEKNQIKEVVADVAKKMLEHPDQYVEADLDAMDKTAPLGPVGKITSKQEEEDSPEQQARDAVTLMGKDDLKQFVQTNFRMELDGRAGVAKMRQQAVELIDRFGIA